MFDVVMRNVESRRGMEEDETGRSGGGARPDWDLRVGFSC